MESVDECGWESISNRIKKKNKKKRPTTKNNSTRTTEKSHWSAEKGHRVSRADLICISGAKIRVEICISAPTIGVSFAYGGTKTLKEKG